MLISDAGVASDAASSKIVDLSKKNRELTAMLESERSKSTRLLQRVNELERKVGNLHVEYAVICCMVCGENR